MEVGGDIGRESDEERVRRELAVLFGPEEEISDSGSSEDCEWPPVTSWPPATSLHPEELYGYLEGEGLLRLPVTVTALIPTDARSSDCDYRVWGEWRSKQVRLVRDTTSSDRIKYLTEVSPIEVETGEEVFVSRIWSGDRLPPLVGFGSLLEGNEGVYRAGIEVDRAGFRWTTIRRHFKSQAESIKRIEEQQAMVLKLTRDHAEVLKSLPKVTPGSMQPVIVEMESKLRTYADVMKVTQDSMLAELEGKLKGHAEEAKVAQFTLMNEQEREKAERRNRSLNIRVSGLEESASEDVTSLVQDLFRDVLKVATPRIIHATRVGRSDRNMRPILVKFSTPEDRAVILGNRGMLRGRKVWLDPDLTPSQAADKRVELTKVMQAVEEGWVAFLRDGRAVITTRRREDQ
ncbi:hypothetical protein R1sor_010465 [Riccia sorocarpa]|uniref:Uncharacterized protein n=1 Tax=Riccia sorocarpa TaxID=122646 RepID=A0ABD3I1J4_9MARC